MYETGSPYVIKILQILWEFLYARAIPNRALSRQKAIVIPKLIFRTPKLAIFKTMCSALFQILIRLRWLKISRIQQRQVELSTESTYISIYFTLAEDSLCFLGKKKSICSQQKASENEWSTYKYKRNCSCSFICCHLICCFWSINLSIHLSFTNTHVKFKLQLSLLY